MVPKWAAAPILFALIGCQGVDENVFLSAPEIQDAKTIVFAFPDRAPAEIELHSTSSPFRVFANSGETAYAFGSAADLESTGVKEGTVSPPGPADTTIALQTLLGSPLSPQRAFYDPETKSASWVAAEQIPQTISNQKVPTALPPCATFPEIGVARQTESRVTYLIALDETHALLGTWNFGQFLVSKDQFEPMVTSLDYEMILAAREDDTIWAMDLRGVVYRGSPSITEGITDTSSITQSPLDGFIINFAARGGRFVIVDDSGDTAYFDGEAWVELPPMKVQNFQDAKLAITDDEAFYWLRGAPTIGRISLNGEARQEVVDIPDGVLSIKVIEGQGVVLGSGRGAFFFRRGTSWELIGGDYGWWAVDMTPFPDGFIFLLASGTIGQYREGRPDLCETYSVLGFINDGKLATVGRDVVVGGSIDGGVEAHFLDFE